MSSAPVSSVLSALLFLGAALCVYLYLLNRYLIQRPDGRCKSVLILLLLGLVVVSSLWIGFQLPWIPWALLPGSVIGLVIIGECRRSILRRRARGSPPVARIPHRIEGSRLSSTLDLVSFRYELALPEWNGPAFRIVHLTDLHINPRFAGEYYDRVFQVAREYEPDLGIITGDLITRLTSLPSLEEALEPFGTRWTFAVLGNHDYWAGAEQVRTVVRRSGITLLSDESVDLELDGAPIRVTGHDYPWGTKVNSIPSCRSGQLHLVLSHTPDNIYRLSRTTARCVFSGHYHAGQIRIPRIGSIVVPSIYGRRFDHGHFCIGQTHLFVPSGIGAADPPVRVCCRPDLFVIDVKGSPPLV